MSMKALILSTLLMGSPIPALAQAAGAGSTAAKRGCSQRVRSGKPVVQPDAIRRSVARTHYAAAEPRLG